MVGGGGKGLREERLTAPSIRIVAQGKVSAK